MTCIAPCPEVDCLDHHAFTELGEEWDALLRRSYDNRIFSTLAWHQLWWKHFGSDTVRIFTLRNEDDSLAALLPLQIRNSGGERVLRLVGDHNVADYMDALAERQQAQKLLATLWDEALTEVKWDRVELRHVPSGSPLLPALELVGSDRGLSVGVVDDEVCPVAILCPSWDGYLQMLSKKQRHEIRRKLRRAQEGVDWTWRTVTTAEELERDLPIFFRLHEASGREKARFMTPEMRGYFQEMSALYLAQGILRLSVFQREGEDVAAVMGFVYRNRYLLYNSGYHPDHRDHSPGIASVALAMQDAIAERAVAFDFLSGDEPYKYQFGASNTRTCRIEVKRKAS